MPEIKWLPFSLSDERFFTLESTHTGIDKIRLNLVGEAKYPYISRSDKFNGITMLIPKQDIEPDDGNVITIGLDTQTVFYQDTKFYTGQNIIILKVKDLTKNIALFLIPLIKKQLTYLSWGGSGATLTRLRSKNILLPVTKNELPDWNYMEQYIQAKLDILTQRMPKYEKIQTTKDPQTIEKVKWKEFHIKDVFNVKTGNYIPARDLLDGELPRITAKSVNNGIGLYIAENKKAKIHNNAITASFLGNYFYHPYDFTVDMKIHVLKPKQHIMNQYTGLFLTTILNKNLGTFSYGNQLSSSDIKAKIIKLPIDNKEQINWSYMENFMIKKFNDKISILNKE